jgi:hypothetical protein
MEYADAIIRDAEYLTVIKRMGNFPVLKSRDCGITGCNKPGCGIYGC